MAAKKISPLDMLGADTDDPRVIDVAGVLQTLDSQGDEGHDHDHPTVRGCFNLAVRTTLGFYD